MSKLSKYRTCPALGREISSADCGEQRHSRLACPADCPHNPFAPANYSQLLEIEDRLDAKTLDRLMALPPERSSRLKDAAATQGNIAATNAFFVWNIFFERNADNATFAQCWEKAGWMGLKNDERVLLRAKMQMRVALLETHRVFADGHVEGVELELLSSEPVPVIVRDRGLAGMAARFSTILTWLYPLPHFWRLCGTGTPIRDMAQFSAPEIIREIVHHLGGPATESDMRRWLAEHFMHFHDALQVTERLRHRQMFARMDAKYGKAVYELRALFAQCCKQLDTLPMVTQEDLSPEERKEGFVEARVWFDAQPQSKLLTTPDGRMVLGRVLLGQSVWRLEAFGAEKFARLRRQFEERLGERVRFRAERVDDLGARLDAGQPAVEESLAPPRLLENPAQLIIASSRVPARPPGLSLEDAGEELCRAAERMFLDERVPALDHRTPREAARDPALRPKLIHLMKQRVRSLDERNLRDGRDPKSNDITGWLRELELDEIIFDPPPWRPPPAQMLEEEELDTDDFDRPIEPDPNRPPAPPLPAAPLEIDEAARRLENALDMFATAAEAEHELYASGATYLDDIERFTLDRLAEDDFCFAIPFLLQVWFALVPRGCRAPQINYQKLENTFMSNLRELELCTQARTPKKLEAFFQTGPQPNFMLLLLSGFLHAVTKAPAKFQPKLEAQPCILALLKSVVQELDAALGRQ